MDEILHRNIFTDVVRGYSVVNYNDSQIYLKHLSPLDQSEIDSKYTEALNEGIVDGFPLAETQLNEIIKDGSWSKQKELEIEGLKTYAKNLIETKSNLFIPSQIEESNKLIKETELKIEELSTERSSLLGTTAEAYANKRMNDYSVFYLLFKDPKFKKRYFEYSDYEYLDESTILKLFFLINIALSKFDRKSLRFLAIDEFFLSIFALSGEDIWKFYGKPATKLTYYQFEMYGYLRTFRNIFDSIKETIPDDVRKDPDLIIDWFNGKSSFNKMQNKIQGGEKGSTSYVGLKSEDLKEMGLESSNGILIEALKKKGGELSLDEMMKLRQMS